MSNTAKKEIFIPRSHLQRTLKYRPHLIWSYYTLNVLGTTIWLLTTLSLAAFSTFGSALEILVFLGLSSVIPMALLIQARFLIRPFAFSTIQVFNDRLEIDRMGERNTVLYSDIAKVEFSHLPYTGGWFKVITAKQTFRFTVVLERSEYILESIAAFNPGLMNSAHLEFYRRTAIVSDHSWSYLYEKMKNWKKLLLKFLVRPLAAASLLAFLESLRHSDTMLKTWLQFSTALMAAQVLVSLSLYFISSIVFAAHTRSALIQNPNLTARDKEFEGKIESQFSNLQRLLMGLLATGLAVWIFLK